MKAVWCFSAHELVSGEPSSFLQRIQLRHTVVARDAALGIDQGGVGLERHRALHDPRIAGGPIDGGHCKKTHGLAVLVDLQLERH